MQNSCAPYTPRNPRLSDYSRCVEDFFEELERVHVELYQSRFGCLRPEMVKIWCFDGRAVVVAGDGA